MNSLKLMWVKAGLQSTYYARTRHEHLVIVSMIIGVTSETEFRLTLMWESPQVLI